jgi:hypothetical protein
MRLLIISTILLIISCDNKTKENDLLEYKDGRQLLTLNYVKRNGDSLDPIAFGLLSPNTIRVGEEFVARIFLMDSSCKIVAAYFNCNRVNNPSVDTTSLDSSGCKIRLHVEHDTIYIAFKSDTVGTKAVDPLTILTRDKEKVFRTLDYRYTMKVVEK